MEIGDIVEHKNKVSISGYPHDNQYKFDGVCRLKDPTTHKWIDGAVYSHNGQVFVRELADFYKKFKKVR